MFISNLRKDSPSILLCFFGVLGQGYDAQPEVTEEAEGADQDDS